MNDQQFAILALIISFISSLVIVFIISKILQLLKKKFKKPKSEAQKAADVLFETVRLGKTTFPRTEFIMAPPTDKINMMDNHGNMYFVNDMGYIQRCNEKEDDTPKENVMEKDIELGMGDKFIDHDGMTWTLISAREDASQNGYMYYQISNIQDYIMEVNKSIIRQMMRGPKRKEETK